jgi:hypothetical protein
MAITKELKASANQTRVGWNVFAAFVLIAAIAVVLIARKRPPQMGADPKVMNTVDALYTAVRNQDETRVTECERRLHGYRDAGMLPKKAAEHLDEVIAMTRAGKWDPAARRLYDFMMVQRRDGPTDR